MKHQAEVIQFQKKRIATKICSACGEDRFCDCNAPAIEKAAAAIAANPRISDRALAGIAGVSRETVRRARTDTGMSVDERIGLDGRKRKLPTRNANDPIEEICADCNTDEDRWQRSISNMAGDAVSLSSYWKREFGDWQKFGVPRDLAKLATQAAEAWKQIASELNQRIK